MKASGVRGRGWDSDRETVVALFGSQADAEHAVHELKQAGFPQGSIGVVLRDPAYWRRAARQGDTTALPGDTAPAGGGGIIGGVVGLLAGVGAVALPGVGPVIAGGVLVNSLTGAGLGAAAGGVLGTLTGMGIPDAAARYFEAGVREGSVLITVDAGTRGDAAREILSSSRGDLGYGFRSEEQEASDIGDDEAWRGSERRYRDDPAYHGPERRFSARS
jgi:hypothetical protein